MSAKLSFVSTRPDSRSQMIISLSEFAAICLPSGESARVAARLPKPENWRTRRPDFISQRLTLFPLVQKPVVLGQCHRLPSHRAGRRDQLDGKILGPLLRSALGNARVDRE